MSPTPVRETLEALTVPGELFVREGEKLRCVACGHRCVIPPGRDGVCRVRSNQAGELQLRLIRYVPRSFARVQVE